MDRIGVESWLKSYEIENYTINEDLSVDVNGSVSLSNMELKKIPVRFRNVSGDFICSQNKLTSLLGCPIRVYGVFSCYDNKLHSLEYCPVEVGGSFSCGKNQLTDLAFSPIRVGGNFNCYNNNLLSSLEGCTLNLGGKINCTINNICESELFLINLTPEQISGYYSSKNLSEKLLGELGEETVVGTKYKKL